MQKVIASVFFGVRRPRLPLPLGVSPHVPGDIRKKSLSRKAIKARGSDFASFALYTTTNPSLPPSRPILIVPLSHVMEEVRWRSYCALSRKIGAHTGGRSTFKSRRRIYSAANDFYPDWVK